MQTIIIVGGGAAGLMAAYELSKQNKYKIIVLEAAERLGGRMHTYTDDLFSMPVELGAEFVHGDLPLTLSLLKQAEINYYKINGNMSYVEKGLFIKEKDEDKYWNDVMKQMKALKKDMPLSEFLISFFNDDKYEKTRQSVKGFAEGFDLADVSKASTCSLYNEWIHEEDAQYRIDGGYIQLINYLVSECKKSDCIFLTDCCVKKINWSKGEVNVLTMCSRFFKGDKIIIAVPLSVLQVDKNDMNYIEFAPEINHHLNAAKNIGFGAVIKIIIEFNEVFWQSKKKDVCFIQTNEKISFWWTQLPNEKAILTGWLGGPKALELKDVTDEELIAISLQSLSSAFNINIDKLKEKVKAQQVLNWANIKHIHGGYSYNLVGSMEAKKLLQQPINETIFFAGEAIYEGKSEGTVEAALISGKQAVSRLMQENFA